MKWTSLNDLRESYLAFFESKGHLRHESYSLIPDGDKSLLLINAGMAPLKKYFTGEEEPPRHRMTTCQKCIRTGDIDNVGHTARHGTFFEMLGNFSFGDYFKEEAIPWAWEYLTKVLEIPEERLYPSIYEDDDEAFEIWNKKVGVPAEKIKRLGKADNFWEHGSGPCGPCSEIYFDRGEKYGCNSPDCGVGCDCDRFIEIWNNVFTQFNNDGNGNYTPLATKNIDTGMGLERLACVMQDVDNLFEVDTVRSILDTVCKISGKKYGENADDDVSIRIITDHVRSATFMISDGVVPSNEGRGYVLRRLLRRAARRGRLLGIDGAFLHELCETVVAQSGKAYPALCDKKDYIKKIILMEEERFGKTVDAGLGILANYMESAKSAGENTLSGEAVFKLYDTFGFPPDLTKEIAKEGNFEIDSEGFDKLMLLQKERARAARADLSSWEGASKTFVSEFEKTDFRGYTDRLTESKILALVTDEGRVDSVGEGDVQVILSATVCYGEGGGQVGDCGLITKDGASLKVNTTKKEDGVYIHFCTVENGTFAEGDSVTVSYNKKIRRMTMANHSAAHLLQAALRKILGTHVEQAGSYVDESEVRFDFSHFAAMTDDELIMTEVLVNSYILEGIPVETVETDVETAKAAGAVALFGEKYGKTVRMVKMGDASTELCGGTHVDNTSKIGLFKIISESSVASGVRRIVGVTGRGVLRVSAERDELISKTAKALKVSNPSDIAQKAAQLTAELAECKREIETLNSKIASGKVGEILSSAEEVGAFKVASADLEATGADAARSLADKLRDKCPQIVAVLAIHSGEKLNFVVACGPEAVKAGAHAGKIAGAVAAICGGKGGGRPDSAMSGGKDASKIPEALASVKEFLKN